MSCLFNLARFHLPSLALHWSSKSSKCCPCGVSFISEDMPLPHRNLTGDGADRKACMCSLLFPRFWQYRSNYTRWTLYSLGVTVLGVYKHLARSLEWGWICSVQDLGSSKGLFAAACLKVDWNWVHLVLQQWDLYIRETARSRRHSALFQSQHIVLGFP